MKTFYADDTYRDFDTSEVMPRLHLFGGIVINASEEKSVIQKMEQVKKKYTQPQMPVNWQFNDKIIKDVYEKYGRLDEFETMLQETQVWQKEFATILSNSSAQILVACIQVYSDKIQIIQESLQLLFENTLMRLAIDAKKSKGKWQCVLHSAQISEVKSFDQSYYSLLNLGETLTKIKLPTGPLKPLGFNHSLLYAKIVHSPLSQLADIVIGATREHLETVIQRRTYSFGTEMIQLMKSNFLAQERKIPGFGVFAPNGSPELKDAIKRSF